MTAPDTTIEPPKKIFDALDMIDIWLYNAHQIDRDDSIKYSTWDRYPAGINFTVASCVSVTFQSKYSSNSSSASSSPAIVTTSSTFIPSSILD